LGILALDHFEGEVVHDQFSSFRLPLLKQKADEVDVFFWSHSDSLATLTLSLSVQRYCRVSLFMRFNWSLQEAPPTISVSVVAIMTFSEASPGYGATA
jgi:hypothetical protein